MTKGILQIKPLDIEAKSFAIIEEEFAARTGRRQQDFSAAQFAVIRRVIHATGDFSFAENLLFHQQAIQAANKAIKAGKNIVTDVNMTAAGINKKILADYGGRVICNIMGPKIAALAKERGTTRSEVAIESAMGPDTGIVVIGNAPTALLKIIELCKDSANLTRPELIIGVPVGFVNAAESKELLSEQEWPFITTLGRKGGSPVAAAIVNALLKLAENG